jgi:hypothetical protein
MTNVLDLKHPELTPEHVVAEPVPNQELATANQFLALGLNALAGPEALEWEAHHPLNEQSRYRHYVALAGFVVVGGAVSIWQSSVFTFITVALALVAWELHERFSKPVRVRVDERGVAVDGRYYPHTALTSFDLHRMSDGAVELSLATRQWHSRMVRLPLGDQDPTAVRGLLLSYLVEEEHPIPLVDRLIRR